MGIGSLGIFALRRSGPRAYSRTPARSILRGFASTPLRSYGLKLMYEWVAASRCLAWLALLLGS